jgi:hypothetical protein
LRRVLDKRRGLDVTSRLAPRPLKNTIVFFKEINGFVCWSKNAQAFHGRGTGGVPVAASG